jgi:signal transduction histidine kinase
MDEILPDIAEVADIPAEFREHYLRILETLCGCADFETAGRLVLREIREISGCEAVAFRIYNGKEDFPYYMYDGFEDSFVEKESSLCTRGKSDRIQRNADGSARLECVCGLVIGNKTNSDLSFFTQNGSFWTNSTTELLSSDEAPKLGITTRNVCNAFGYESAALVPLRTDNGIVGLIQANSRERGRFSLSIIEFLERIGRHVGTTLQALWRRRELSRLSREFEDRRRHAETMIAIGEISATLAHELKNPLAGMMMSATRLRKALKEIEGGEKLVSIAEQLCTATSTLSETVSRVSQTIREPSFNLEKTCVNDMLESAVSLISVQPSAQDIRIIYELSPELPAVTADANLLMRAFLNLLQNALDAMPSGGILRLSTEMPDDDHVEITIADTGTGIDSDNIESLFEPFVTTKEHGTGLGLAVVRRILEMHSGTVMLRPGSGGGTEAVVRLPLNVEKPTSGRMHIV